MSIRYVSVCVVVISVLLFGVGLLVLQISVCVTRVRVCVCVNKVCECLCCYFCFVIWSWSVSSQEKVCIRVCVIVVFSEKCTIRHVVIFSVNV